MKMYVGTDWVDAADSIEVLNPFDGSVVDTVPKARAADVDRAIATAERGAQSMASLTGYRTVPDSASCGRSHLGNGLTTWPPRSRAKRARSSARRELRQPERPRSFTFPPRKPSVSTAKLFRSRAAPGSRASSDSRCECRAEWWWRSARSTSPCIWSVTRSDLRWLRGIRSSSSRPPTRHCPRSSSWKYCSRPERHPTRCSALRAPGRILATRWWPIPESGR